MISPEELEMMENDLTEGKDMIRDCRYSTEKSFSIGFHRIPRKELNTVYLGKVSSGRSFGHELVFYYEYGTFVKAVPFSGELSTLSNGNLFWQLMAKSRDKWNGCKEVEIALRGTALTYLLYLVWICLSVCFVFFFADLLEVFVSHVILIAGLCCLVPELCYYKFFYKSARKITDKAMDIFYRDFYRNSDE